MDNRRHLCYLGEGLLEGLLVLIFWLLQDGKVLPADRGPGRSHHCCGGGGFRLLLLFHDVANREREWESTQTKETQRWPGCELGKKWHLEENPFAIAIGGLI